MPQTKSPLVPVDTLWLFILVIFMCFGHISLANNPSPTNPLDSFAIPDPLSEFSTTTRRHKIIVAIVDTGVDYRHEDLHEHMWVNKSEMSGLDGVDNDHSAQKMPSLTNKVVAGGRIDIYNALRLAASKTN